MLLVPLHDRLGVEVREFDVLAATPADEVAALRRALDDHQLLLFRTGVRIPPDRQVEIMRWFGPLVDMLGEGRHWTTLTNADAAGRVRLPFHSDLTYTDTPIEVISLHALEAPPAGVPTCFTSGIAAWATLRPELRCAVADRTARHFYRSPVRADLPIFVAHHPVRFVHPRTGTPVLFVTELNADRIDGVDPDASAHLLAELLDHLYRPEAVYEHRWQRHDLVIWDNLAVQHARPTEAAVAAGERTFQRVSVAERSFVELTARAREARYQAD